MLEYRVTPLPPVWPGKATSSYHRQNARFKRAWTAVLRVLAREVGALGGRRVELAVDVPPTMLRQDGQLRADARPRSPSVILSFDVPEGKLTTRLQFPCDTFTAWQDNVDAIARALEALRLVDRYGVQQGRQYAGFKALPSATVPTMSSDAAAQVILDASHVISLTLRDLLTDRDSALRAIKFARASAHPDRHNGERAAYDAVDAAAEVLTRHHGGAQ